MTNRGIPLLYDGEIEKEMLVVTMECKQDSMHLYVINDKGLVNLLGEYFKYDTLSVKVPTLKDIKKIQDDSRFMFCEITYHRLIGYWAVKNEKLGVIKNLPL